METQLWRARPVYTEVGSTQWNWLKEFGQTMISRKEAVPARRQLEAPSNRSLERGLRILRAFRPGTTVLGNSEIAESTGLPRSTVSRLTQTLVACGFLERDSAANAYRLGPPVLSLSEALLSSSDLLEFARPIMRELSERLGANVSLAVADEYEMVYLETIRHRSGGLNRRSNTGRRTPMEMTAFGRAHLAALPASERRSLMTEFQKRHKGNWQTIRGEINEAITDVAGKGYCSAAWLEGVMAIATPIETRDRRQYVLGLSGSTELFGRRLQNELLPEFLAAAARLRNWAAGTL